jgi:hypothetical protein
MDARLASKVYPRGMVPSWLTAIATAAGVVVTDIWGKALGVDVVTAINAAGALVVAVVVHESHKTARAADANVTAYRIAQRTHPVTPAGPPAGVTLTPEMVSEGSALLSGLMGLAPAPVEDHGTDTGGALGSTQSR